MLTVQETLKTIEPNELISSYVYRLLSDKINLLETPDTVTFGEFMDNKKHNASIIIDNLINAEIKEESDSILLACHRYDTNLDDIVFELVEIKDILSKQWKKKAQGYCYMAEPFEKIAAYKIADTYLTQRNLHELLVDVMYESAWFGPNQEGQDSFIKRLDESMQHKEESKPISELWEYFEEEFDWTPEIRDKKEEKKERKINLNTYKYNRRCFLNEVAKVRKTLLQNKGE